jgi:hypothetical protein
VWAVLDAVVDDYRPVVEQVENDIEDVERSIFTSGKDATERIHVLKQEVNEFYRAVHPLLVPLDALEHGAFGEMSPALVRYFRDVNDHVRRINEDVLSQREQLAGVFDANAALISVRQSEITAPERRGQAAHPRRHGLPAAGLRGRLLRPELRLAGGAHRLRGELPGARHRRAGGAEPAPAGLVQALARAVRPREPDVDVLVGASGRRVG